jgi:hypothetical protein
MTPGPRSVQRPRPPVASPVPRVPGRVPRAQGSGSRPPCPGFRVASPVPRVPAEVWTNACPHTPYGRPGALVALIGPASVLNRAWTDARSVDSGSNSCVADHKARWRRHLSKPGDPMRWRLAPPRPTSPQPASPRPPRPVEPAPDECRRRGDRQTSSNLGVGCRKATDSAQRSSNFGIWCRRIASWAETTSNTFVWCRSNRNGTPSIRLATRHEPDAQARGPGADLARAGRAGTGPGRRPGTSRTRRHGGRPHDPRPGRSSRVPTDEPVRPLKRATNPENRQGPRRSGASWG